MQSLWKRKKTVVCGTSFFRYLGGKLKPVLPEEFETLQPTQAFKNQKKKKKTWQQDVCPCKLGETCIYYVVMCQIMPDLHSVIKPIKDVQF